MRLLLLLSAFLTAMVGVGPVASAAARPACEVSATSSARTERQTPRIAVSPLPTSVAHDRLSFTASALHRAPARTVPLYAERLRV